MSALTFVALREVNVQRCVEGWRHPLESWSLDDWLVAVGGEVGEALNVVKKLKRDSDGIIGNSEGAEQLKADLADELADAVIYLDLFRAAAGIGPIDGTFEFFRNETREHLSSDAAPTPAQCCLKALKGIGRLAQDVSSTVDDGRRRRMSLRTFTLMHCIDGIAWVAGIDLGEAVLAKFNATSAKHSMPHRLAA